MPSGDSRERMLASASELFQRHGYHATSWRQVVDHGDAPWGSINFLFPKGKTQLGREAIDVSAREVDRRLRGVFFDPTDVTRSLVAFVDQTIETLVSSGYERGCPVATVALELAHGEPGVQEACAEAFARWTNTLIELLTPQLGSEASVEVAELFLASYEGALLIARTQQDPGPLNRLGQRLPLLVKAAAS